MAPLVLLLFLALLIIGALPRWPHSCHWSYVPSGVVTLMVVIVGLLMLTGQL